MASDTFQRALDLIELDQPFEALPLLNEAIAAEPEQARAYVQRAKVRKRLKDGEGAIADYSQAIKLAPTAAVYLSRALVWLSLNEVKGAIADSREAIELKPELAGGHRLLGKALGLLGDGKGAIAAYKKAARCYLDNQDKENAQACLDAIGPLKKLPDYDASQASARKDYVQRVQVKYEAGEYGPALTDLNWLLSTDPYQVEALCLRGLIQAQLGRRAFAVADLALAWQQRPEDLEVRFCRGKMRLILKDGYGALEEFSELVEASPEARFFAYRGHSYRQIGEMEKAFEDYGKAIALEDGDAELVEAKAQVQKEMGSVEGAIADFQKAATLWLNEDNWQKHQNVVESVRQLRRQEQQSQTVGRSSSTVPIKHFSRHMPVVDVLFDGITAFEMVIDRNATHSIVTERMAKKLKLEHVSYRYVYLIDGTPMELSLGRLRSVRIGGTIITDVYVAIAPNKETAVLGKNCFSAYSVRISGNEITFLRR